MRRPRHLTVVPGLPHHVTSRGNNRRRLFSRAHDYEFFLRQLRIGLVKYPCTLHALTLMTNHFHLLLTPPDTPTLSNLMKYVQQIYAAYRNERRRGTGKLFEARFFADPVRGDDGLQNVTLYIESNPLRSGLVQDPLDYSWSTYPIHAGEPMRSRVPLAIVSPSSWYNSLAATPSERVRVYRERFAASFEESAKAVDSAAHKVALRAASRYNLRLERPNRTSAREGEPEYDSVAVADLSRRKR